MAGLDKRLVLAPSLEMLFRNKETGLPLRGGKVYFYKDQARTTLKDVYQLTGNPPDYTYTPLPNPVTLSAAGTFADDDGNDILPYYFPYQGTPEESDGTIELYYIKVFAVEDGEEVFQWDRQGWPNATSNGVVVDEIKNYVPNPQFRIHYDLPATDDYSAGEIRENTTILGGGGWSFARSAGADSTDFVTFERYNTWVASPDASPRYRVRIRCTDPGSVTPAHKDLRLKFTDVNKFSTTEDQEEKYTLSFTGEFLGSGSIVIDLYLIKNFGTGGSPSATTETFIDQVTLDNNLQIFNFTFSFEDNIGKTLGTNNDDYLEIAWRLPLDEAYAAVDLDNCILTPGEVIVTGFPQTPDSDFKAKGVAGWMPMPDPNGSQLGLPLILTKEGLAFDDSQVGMPFADITGLLSEPEGYLLADGSKYETEGYSSTGVPFSRIQSKYFDSTYKIPKFGTGWDFFTVTTFASPTLFIVNNTAGAVTNAADGAIPTGFNFKTIHKIGSLPGGMTDYGVFSYREPTNLAQFVIINKLRGAVNPVADHDTGFTFATLRRTSPSVDEYITQVQEISLVTATAATGLEGCAFRFQVITDSIGTTKNGVLWYKVNGSGSQPSIPGTDFYLNVDLDTGDTAIQVASKSAYALNGFQITRVVTTAASAVTAGSYFTLNATDGSSAIPYYFYYIKNGSGDDPEASGTGIAVSITAGQTAAQVGTTTLETSNSKYFGVPDYRGGFPRGMSLGSGNDPAANHRYTLVPGLPGGDTIGTFQYTENLEHYHSPYGSTSFVNVGTGPFAAGGATWVKITSITAPSGGVESRPYNFNVRWLVKY